MPIFTYIILMTGGKGTTSDFCFSLSGALDSHGWLVSGLLVIITHTPEDSHDLK